MGNQNPNSTSKYHCKVSGCNDNHGKHYCKTCKNNDSDHFKTNCPKNKPSFTKYIISTTNNQPQSKDQLHCKVLGCIEIHDKHYCKFCKEFDSNHFSADCVKNNNPIQVSKNINPAPKKCKIPGCTISHDKHYCRFCEDKDSDHFAKDCPESVDLYHATWVSCLEQDNGIKEIGLIPHNNKTKTNRFGVGIYFAEKEISKELIENNFGTEKGVLLKCRVYLGKMKDFTHTPEIEDRDGHWKQDYDSCTAIHPIWRGNKTSRAFQEWVIKESKKVRIYSITYKGKEFKMYDYIKDNEVLENIKKGII